jgi:hypothetical protein
MPTVPPSRRSSTTTMHTHTQLKHQETPPTWDDEFKSLTKAWSVFHPDKKNSERRKKEEKEIEDPDFRAVYTHLKEGILRRFIRAHADLEKDWEQAFRFVEKPGKKSTTVRGIKEDIHKLLVALSRKLYEEATKKDLRTYIELEQGHADYEPTLGQFREKVQEDAGIGTLYWSSHWPFQPLGCSRSEDFSQVGW